MGTLTNERPDRCGKGIHDLTDQRNVYTEPSGHRCCLPCKRERGREYVRKYREKQRERLGQPRTTPVGETTWLQGAACVGADPEMFFLPELWPDAHDLCKICPVVMQCRETFLWEMFGYFGGTTPTQRDEIRRRRKRGQGAPSNIPRPGAHSSMASRTPDIPPDEMARRVCSLYRGGLGLRRISAITGIGRTKVHRILKDSEVPMRTTDQQKELAKTNQVHAYDTEVAKAIRKLVGEGLYTAREVAESVGCHIETVYRIRKRMNNNAQQ